MGAVVRPKGGVAQVECVLAGIAAARRLSVEDIVSIRRSIDIVRARQEGMWMSRVLLDARIRVIGAVFGGRDHSTASHAISKIASRVSCDPDYALELKAICDQVAGLIAEDDPSCIAVLPEADVLALRAACESARKEAEALRQSIASMESRRAMDQASIHRLERALRKAERDVSVFHATGALPALSPVISAYDQLQQDRYGRGEQRAFDRLLSTLSHLKAEMTSAKGASS